MTRTIVLEIYAKAKRDRTEDGISIGYTQDLKLELSIPSRPHVRRDELTERKASLLRDLERSGLPMTHWCEETLTWLGPRETWPEEFR